MPGRAKAPALIYYRFQNDRPKPGDVVHCFTTLKALREFAEMMRGQDPDFKHMRFWEVTGEFVRHDEGDAEVRVISTRQISV